MAKLNLEGKVPGTQKEKTTFSVKGADTMTIEQLVEQIRDKIQRLQKNKAQELQP